MRHRLRAGEEGRLGAKLGKGRVTAQKTPDTNTARTNGKQSFRNRARCVCVRARGDAVTARPHEQKRPKGVFANGRVFLGKAHGDAVTASPLTVVTAAEHSMCWSCGIYAMGLSR